jgi:hypothetical protein
MDEYWDGVRQHWLCFEAGAGSPPANRPSDQIRIKPMLPLSLYRPTLPLVVTGLRGAGKSVLYDSILGKVGNSYVPGGQSFDVEPHRTFIRTKESKIRVQAMVLPGQDSDERSVALVKFFGNRNYPTGVIHATCWGYSTVWDPADRRSVVDEITGEGKKVKIEEIQKWNLREELVDFKDTCDLLAGAWERRSRVWLIIAVTKCDLFWPDIGKARDYYIPGRPSPSQPGAPPRESDFCDALRGLVEYVGGGNLKVAVVPVSCYPQEYKFERVSKKAGLDLGTTSVLVNRFRTLVGEFCEA